MVRRGIAAVALAALGTVGGASAGLLARSATPAAATTAGSAAALTTSSASTTLVITGHGWGHGVGMGQWGAYGYALHGWSAASILAHYYPGTTIGRDPPVSVHVLLAEGARTVTLGSAAAWRVVDGAGRKLTLPPGPLVVPASLRLRGKKLVSPLTFEPGASPVEAGKVSYRGNLRLVSSGKALQLVNVVPLESYLGGVVGLEVPFSWPRAALEAQAIAARSYVLAQIGSGVPARTFDVYSDARSQAYGGIDSESPAVDAAVAATRGRILLYHGKVAMTYFSASTGGETMSSADANGTAVPYLVSVPDPYDTLSPYHDWGPLLMSARGAGKALGLHGALADVTSVLDQSGRVASATVVGKNGQVTLTGPQVQADLGLRSTWFDIGLLELSPLEAPVAAGTALTLFGVVRGLSGVTLEARRPGGDWTAVSRVDPDADGVFSVRIAPVVTTVYRLATGNARGGQITVTVRAT